MLLIAVRCETCESKRYSIDGFSLCLVLVLLIKLLSI